MQDEDLNRSDSVNQFIGGTNAADEDAVAGIIARESREIARELLKTAKGEGEFGVDVKRGGGEAAVGGRKLSGKDELEADLCLAGSTFGDEFGDGVAGNAAAEETIEYGAAYGALFASKRKLL